MSDIRDQFDKEVATPLNKLLNKFKHDRDSLLGVVASSLKSGGYELDDEELGDNRGAQVKNLLLYWFDKDKKNGSNLLHNFPKVCQVLSTDVREAVMANISQTSFKMMF